MALNSSRCWPPFLNKLKCLMVCILEQWSWWSLLMDKMTSPLIADLISCGGVTVRMSTEFTLYDNRQHCLLSAAGREIFNVFCWIASPHPSLSFYKLYSKLFFFFQTFIVFNWLEQFHSNGKCMQICKCSNDVLQMIQPGQIHSDIYYKNKTR